MSRLETLSDVGITRKDFSRWKALASVKPQMRKAYYSEMRERGKQITPNGLRSYAKKPKKKRKVELPIDVFRCLVVDPPWPIDKIERDTRDKQGGKLEYRTMTVDEIKACSFKKNMAKDGCHVYLWTTQRFLVSGEAFDVMKAWGVRPICVLTWCKYRGRNKDNQPVPAGMPLTGLWRYSSEFVIFGRLGGLPVKKNGLSTWFVGEAKGHSVKPDEFYEMVKVASPGPRLDAFARQERDGFQVWGDEVG